MLRQPKCLKTVKSSIIPRESCYCIRIHWTNCQQGAGWVGYHRIIWFNQSFVDKFIAENIRFTNANFQVLWHKNTRSWWKQSLHHGQDCSKCIDPFTSWPNWGSFWQSSERGHLGPSPNYGLPLLQSITCSPHAEPVACNLLIPIYVVPDFMHQSSNRFSCCLWCDLVRFTCGWARKIQSEGKHLDVRGEKK